MEDNTLFSALSTKTCPSEKEAASGFSISICLPCSRHRRAMSRCVDAGVAMMTAVVSASRWQGRHGLLYEIFPGPQDACRVKVVKTAHMRIGFARHLLICMNPALRADNADPYFIHPIPPLPEAFLSGRNMHIPCMIFRIASRHTFFLCSIGLWIGKNKTWRSWIRTSPPSPSHFSIRISIPQFSSVCTRRTKSGSDGPRSWFLSFDSRLNALAQTRITVKGLIVDTAMPTAFGSR